MAMPTTVPCFFYFTRSNDNVNKQSDPEDTPKGSSDLEGLKRKERIRKAKEKQREICERLKRKHSPRNEVTSSNVSPPKMNDTGAHIKMKEQFNNPDGLLLVEDDEGKILRFISL